MERIIGIEHEYDCLFSDSHGEPIEYEENTVRYQVFLNKFFELVEQYAFGEKRDHQTAPGGPHVPAFRLVLQNGGLIYLDLQNIEIASPECIGPREVVLYDGAGDFFLNKILKEWREEKGMPRLTIHKKNTNIVPSTDSGLQLSDKKQLMKPVPASRAFHESYLVERDIFEALMPPMSKDPAKSAESLATPEAKFWSLFLVVRPLITGSGGIIYTGDVPSYKTDYSFVVSPRFFCLNRLFGINTTDHEGRGIIDTRNESHMKEPSREKRLHLICGDSNMLEKAIWLTVGMSSLVLEVLEDGEWDRTLGISTEWLSNERSFGIFLKLIAGNFDGSFPIRLRDRRRQTTLEILWRYYEECARYVSKNGLYRHKALLDEWKRVLVLLGRDWRDCVGILGWPTLKWLLEENAAEKNLPFEDEEMQRMNFDFHNINREEGLYYELREDFERVASEKEIEMAVSSAPKTRADFRAQICRRLKRLGIEFTFNWPTIFFSQKFPGLNEKSDFSINMDVRDTSSFDPESRTAINRIEYLEREGGLYDAP